MDKPAKSINLYYLGKKDPIASFSDNHEEAIECMRHLNKKVVIKAKGPFTKTTLVNEKFYYLTGQSEANEFIQLVDLADYKGPDYIAKFNYRIQVIDGDRSLIDWAPPDENMRPLPGGRKNRKNRNK